MNLLSVRLSHRSGYGASLGREGCLPHTSPRELPQCFPIAPGAGSGPQSMCSVPPPQEWHHPAPSKRRRTNIFPLLTPRLPFWSQSAWRPLGPEAARKIKSELFSLVWRWSDIQSQPFTWTLGPRKTALFIVPWPRGAHSFLLNGWSWKRERLMNDDTTISLFFFQVTEKDFFNESLSTNVGFWLFSWFFF